ncbi:MAG: heavy-metal-associated domain-containing protein [Thermodesulfovibrionales bacterium]
MAASSAAQSIPGVKFADDNPDDYSLTIIFDDTRTGLDEIRKAMQKSGFPVLGDPVPVR